MMGYKTAFISAAFAALLAIFLSVSANAASQQASTASGVGQILSASYEGWFPVVISGAFLILAIVALVYVLAPLVGRSDLKAWARLQFYGVVFSILLIFIFEAFGTLLYTIDPTNALNGIGVVPGSCINAQNLFELALCDIYQFNQVAVGNANYYAFIIGLRTSILPEIDVSINLIPGVQNFGFGESLSLFPFGLPIGSIIEALAVAYTLNQVQLIIIAASSLIFAVFISIGLIARIFGVTRSFGGAMMAFALGIGFLYPLMTAITYGFVDNVIAQQSGTVLAEITFLLIFSLTPILNNILIAVLVGGTAVSFSLILLNLSGIIEYFGLIAVGLTIVPLMNFVVVDTFIVDFSQAVGEKMDFMSLLAGLI